MQNVMKARYIQVFKLDEFVLDEHVSSEFSEIQEVSDKDVAIIGISLKFPKADTVNKYWDNLKEGIDCIDELSDERKKDAVSYLNSIGIDENVKFGKGAYIDDIDKFDFKFFNISPKEAELMHPNQRLFLQTVWRAIEDAGYSGKRIRGTNTGVFLGHSVAPFVDTFYDYSRFIMEENPSLISMAIPGNLNSLIASRISYLLDLKGPSLLIDTACSSSLVAIHTACQSIKNGECDMAIAGGLKLHLFPLEDDHYKLGIESSDDRAKTFDDSSDGTGKGEGIAAVILKPLSKAVKDRDNIYAVIKGSAINQDGSSVGITAPNALRQEEVIIEAIEDAGINPETIGYIEAHGTGTKLGDPIEITGITRAYQRYTDRKQFCAIGSVKTNIGHLDAAAGIAGLVKSILALKYKKLPPTLHFEYPNKKIDFEDSPVYLNNTLREWEYEGYPRRCGVSSFGLSGTNCHLILEEAPNMETSQKVYSDESYIFTASAKSKDSLKMLINDYKQFLEQEEEISLVNLCYTASLGREHYNHRLAIIVKSIDDLKEKLSIVNSNNFDNNDYIYMNTLNATKSKIPTFDEKAPLLSNKIDENMKGLSTFNNGNNELLEKICYSYTMGTDIDWEYFYKDNLLNKIALPTYPFEKERCWFEVSRIKKELITLDTNKIENKAIVHLLGKKREDYTEIELKVAQVWGEFLGFKELRLEDNFYELGGDSIIASKIVNSINKLLGSKLEVTSLLRYSTLKDFLNYIANNTEVKDEYSKDIFVIEGTEYREYYPITPIQRQVFTQAQFKGIGTALNTPVVIEFEGLIDRHKLEVAFNELIHRHESLRTSFTIANGEIVQQIHNNVYLNIKHLNVTEKDIDVVINQQIQPFDLQKAPLVRVSLLRTDKKDRLFVDLHHIISDGTSYDILIKDLIDLYECKLLSPVDIQYKDYVVWHENFKTTPYMLKQKNYWKMVLEKDIPELELPLDYERKKNRSFIGKTVSFDISKEVIESLNKLTRELNVTLNTVLFGAYTLLLNQYNNQQDIVVGTVVSGRTNKQVESVLGAFINLLPIRNIVNPNDKLKSFIQTCNENLLLAYDNQDYHYTSMIEDFKIKLDKTRNPLFDTALIFHNEYNQNKIFEIDHLPFSVNPVTTNQSQLDLKLDFFMDDAQGLRGMMEYKTDLFSEETINELLENYQFILKELITKSDHSIKNISIPSKNKISQSNSIKVIEDTGDDKTIDVTVSATFTAELIEEHITWWGNSFDMNLNVKFAPYNQVFMELLQPNSLLSTNTGVNLILIRFEDWIRADMAATDHKKCESLQRNYNDLIEMLNTKQNNIPYFFGLFPVSTHLDLSSMVVEFIESLNLQLIKDIETLENIYVVDFRKINKLYNIRDVFDPLKDKEGHIPFTNEFYAALGATVFRKIHSWKKQTFKVIVLDCDNTLWKGVCGEDGYLGVEVDEYFTKIQKFMLQKYNEGMLLTLCSKNNEQDVWDVFSKNPGMKLKKEHFVHHKINWSSKSENIKALAEELNLGLDSFIFIDDNAAECSEVMTNLPEVLTLHLPVDISQIPYFLQHSWAFDRLQVTEEDRKRSQMYMSEQKRKSVQKYAQTLPDYLKGLELKMSMNKVKQSQIARISQLTNRTNQFNLSTKRRSEVEIEDLMNSPDVTVWAIEVSDRFGDYGLVGVVISKENGKTLFIDTLLLSCRVLGRNVEDAILCGLKEFCKEKNLNKIEAKFYPTEKNIPFLNFIEKSKWKIKSREESYTLYQLQLDVIPPVDTIECYFNSWYKSEEHTLTTNDSGELSNGNKVAKFEDKKDILQSNLSWEVLITNEANLIHRRFLLPLQNYTGELLLQLTQDIQQKNIERVGEYIAPKTEAEKMIAKVWQDVLGVEKVSITDNFFELGGTSLDGIQVISKLSMDFEAQLNDIFEYDTIESFAKNISFNKNYLMSLLNKKENIAKSKGNHSFDLDSEIQLKTEWYDRQITTYENLDVSEKVDYRNILLTGSTGYLGAHLLHDLLIETSCDIHVIIRGADVHESKNRLEQKLSFYFTASLYEQYKHRIFVYNGDLSKSFMGLTESIYNELADKIDCVINPAANVNHYGKFEDSYEINVKGTESLIKFASTGIQKDINHISTPLVAFGSIPGIDNFLFTEFDYDVGQEDENIYFRTKLEAEKLIVKARESGLNANIYRVGNLNYNSNTLKFQENISSNAFYSVVKSFIKINMIPAFEEKVIDFSFVNDVSKAITLLFNRKNLKNETHHVYNYNGISSIELGEFLQREGYSDLKICDINELFANYENPELQEHIMKIVIHAGLMGNIRDTNFRMVFAKTKVLLDKVGFEWPGINQKNIANMLNYSKEVQFI